MTRDDRSSPRDREPTHPDGLAARTREEGVEPAPVESSPTPQDSARKPFNPWRFGFHTVSPEHRRELLEMELPETPPERLFNQDAIDSKAETSGSAPPALTIDAQDATRSGEDTSRKADTLRLHRGPPLVHPVRTASVWAGVATVVVAAVLWILFGGTKAPPEPPPAVAKTPAAEPRRAVTSVPPPTVASSNALPAPRDVEPAIQPAKAAVSATKKADASPASGLPPAGQMPARTPPPKAEAPVASPGKSKGAAAGDDASPFGQWTAPPRD